MQERRVTVSGQSHVLPTPFHVLATQNPLEQEGTYPLPEAQLDRFLMEIDVGYPDITAERQMLIETTGVQQSEAHAVMTAEELMQVQQLVRRVPVGERSEEHTSELQSLMRISYAVFCLKKKRTKQQRTCS